MSETIPQELIQIARSASTYQAAIQLACTPLIQQGYIEASYVSRIFDAIETFGPYIILADEFALPHAEPGNDVLQTGFSVLVLENPVDLLGQPVSVMIVLASINSTDHIERLKSLATFLMESTNLEDLRSCRSVKEIHRLLQERWT
jgi:mannitol/fructose-specific phosphotransferase system IIA component (Ntr-type)